MINTTLLLKLLKFCVVGASGMLVDFSCTYLLKEKLKIDKYLANSVGFVLAASSNYFLNRLWTFQSSNKAISTEYLMFFIIALAGLGFSNLFVYLFHDRLKLHFYFSKLLAIGIVTIWNFTMNYLFTFG